MKNRFADFLVVKTATGTAHHAVADLNKILIGMAKDQAMLNGMTAMVLNGNGVSRNGMTVQMDSIDTWGDLL